MLSGVEAEDRGQSGAIASSIKNSLTVRSPIFSFVIGEGGSGGAVALGLGTLIMLDMQFIPLFHQRVAHQFYGDQLIIQKVQLKT